MDTLRPARTETYEHTITGLLTKRAELFNEAERIGIEEKEVNIGVSQTDSSGSRRIKKTGESRPWFDFCTMP